MRFTFPLIKSSFRAKVENPLYYRIRITYVDFNSSKKSEDQRCNIFLIIAYRENLIRQANQKYAKPIFFP